MITSADNEKLKLVRKLHERRWRDKLGLFFVEGEDLVEAATAEPVELLVASENVAPELLAAVSTAAHPPRVIGVYRIFPSRASIAAEPLASRTITRSPSMYIANSILLSVSRRSATRAGCVVRAAAYVTSPLISSTTSLGHSRRSVTRNPADCSSFSTPMFFDATMLCP